MPVSRLRVLFLFIWAISVPVHGVEVYGDIRAKKEESFVGIQLNSQGLTLANNREVQTTYYPAAQMVQEAGGDHQLLALMMSNGELSCCDTPSTGNNPPTLAARTEGDTSEGTS